jgi:hypothetical protein
MGSSDEKQSKNEDMPNAVQRTVFFSKRRKNSSLCAGHSAALISASVTGANYTLLLRALHAKPYGTESLMSYDGPLKLGRKFISTVQAILECSSKRTTRAV